MIQINNDLATKALMSIGNEQQTAKRAASGFPSVVGGSSTDSQRSAPLKRTRSRFGLSGSFDMGEFLQASQQVEDTIAFPAIEWPSFDDDDSSSSDSDSAATSFATPRERREHFDDDEEEEDFCFSRRKRQCRGLTRSDRSCDLSSLIDVANHAERRGSNGSMS
uniref:Uncharacterized protein n=1 Tax=Pseudo-nitzschia delicatissima TaxID=44447 RepID=A0A7S0UMI9_9STRA|mmetsp:Transcript_919/g.1869  ORF Transcript_919/g.1869 Transcript_919/m.1869 type:complete len:164 (+) Transcript_919:49-540(+)